MPLQPLQFYDDLQKLTRAFEQRKTLPENCPDCGQALNEPQRPMGKLGRFAVWCATCEGCHTPPKPPADPEPADA